MTLAALVGFLSVAFGAFAAHGVAEPYARGLLETGSRYAFMHAMATVACAVFIELGAVRARHAPALFLPGVVIFSGSLFAMAFGAPRWLGAVTPLGGLLFLGGWAVLAWSAAAIDRPRA
ncbi:MAG: DUF423 domain-containing protein [Phenylobacterium sp.]|uniref:DUF423 domain-containing protein n=1 Tax=Phenylobacterium sp. TaxID=1871053 RepID=UPI00273659A3|nr:DUF423 domain-containing protein [Phenylobacterium sp.]MDP3175390.1 DUF423 domain-containing protein [Phenylobacterium sp.]